MTTSTDIIWQPSPDFKANSQMAKFAQAMGQPLNYRTLHQWSVTDREAFWGGIWDQCGVIGSKGERTLVDGDKMSGAKFFPDAQLNFAENLLREPDDSPAISWWSEPGKLGEMTRAELHGRVAQYAQAFRNAGVGRGDRVAMMASNGPETIAVMLAAASLGAVFSSCSPDFGVDGVLDRFGQVEPKVFVGIDQYIYNGKTFDVREKLTAVRQGLPSVTLALQAAFHANEPLTAAEGLITTSDHLPGQPETLTFTPVGFNDPLYILFSSGTTGKPKCIVHAVGGVLLQHLKEHQLHCDIREGDKVFYFTTCGWMMWNWLVSALALKAEVVLYDGSPFGRTGKALFKLAAEEQVTFFGISAKFIDALRKTPLKPKKLFDLSHIRTVASTGSPLAPEGFDYIHEHIAPQAQIASISGGTDIVSCFMLANPLEPVHRGEIVGPGLGMAVEIWDDEGRALDVGAGELVCSRAFPVMPIGFWHDPDGEKYKSAYFDTYDNIWRHGDWVEKTQRGGFIIHGRSDATLNPGGVRIGTAEIYAQVEKIEEVLEAVCVGQSWNNDVRVVLFVRLKDGAELTADLKDRIRTQVRTGASPRHVPEVIVAVDDIPRTKSGKITELAVRDVIHGKAVKNVHALANPEALEAYQQIPELQPEVSA